MTKDSSVTKEVLNVIKRRVEPGHPVTRKEWKFAYTIVRVNAIADTLIWKQKYITIKG